MTEAIRMRAAGTALPAPIEACDGPAVRRPMLEGFEVLLEEVAPAAEEEQAALRWSLGLQLEAAQRPAVRRRPGFDSQCVGNPAARRQIHGISRPLGFASLLAEGQTLRP